MPRFAFAALLLAISWILAAQPSTRRSFEVASIKPRAADCTGPGPASGPTPGRIELPCSLVRSLIRIAYGSFTADQLAARPMQVLGGPGWLDTDRYDISAKSEGRASAAEMLGPMLQTLLEERFQLKAHVEAKESPVYALTVPKTTPRLTPAKKVSASHST